MKKLFIIPILFALIFSQSKNNQIYYRIYTDTKSYPNVSIESVYNEEVEVYDRNLNVKFNIAIASIKIIQQKGLKPSFFGQTIGAGGGIFCGFMSGLLWGPLIMGAEFFYPFSYPSQSELLLYRILVFTSMGGGAVLGSKFIGKFFASKPYGSMNLADFSIPEKKAYLQALPKK